MTDLTIVVPTIGRPTLQRALDSVLAQTVPVEFIVASDVAREGCGPTMNRAVAAVKTEYVGFVADDDRLSVHYHEWFLEENPGADLFIFTMRYEDGHELPRITNPDGLIHGEVGASFLMRTEVCREFPYVKEVVEQGYNEDWEMISAVRTAGYRIHISQRVAYFIRY